MPFKNPLLQAFDAAPFSKIKPEHFEPAFKKCIENAETEINAIAFSSEKADFENTIEALAFAGEQLDRVSSIFFNLNSAETNEKIQLIAQEISPWLTEFQNNILLNEKLFQRVKRVFNQKDKLQLTPEQKTLLEKKYKSFVRNGAKLSEDGKKKLREIDKKLAQLSLTFGENVLAETNNFELHLTNKNDLKGLPESDIETAAKLAEDKGKKGYIITLHYPSYLPFMKYAENRELRKKLAIAFGSKAFQGNKFDNRKNVLEIAELRHERANLLGYKTHAHFVLEERMAKTPEKVNEFMDELLEKAKPAAKKEFAELENFAKKLDNIDRLETWDAAYYSEKLKQKLFDLDDEKLKPYFPLEKAIDGVFRVAKKLYGLKFKEVFNVDKYHEEVKTYEVSDENGNFTALFYADFHPREGKRNDAWMTVYKNQKIEDGKNQRPHISIVCNFSRPTSTRPALLTFNEVTTLFHEFGHALHGMLANTTYPGLSGTSVYWDFVELPSQILENWCYEEKALNLFAKHYKTGEPIPMELIEKIKKAAKFQEGMQTLRQLGFGMLDMAWHSSTRLRQAQSDISEQTPSQVEEVKNLEEKSFERTRLYPKNPETCMSTSFSHIFGGGYSAGYYSYKWAEVLDADAFECFKENGIFDAETAKSFKKNILSKGGTEAPMVLYKRFRGKEPDPEALLRRAGLINTD